MASSVVAARRADESAPAVVEPVYLLSAGPMRAHVRPQSGGRLAALWREESDRRRTNILVPMPDGSFDPDVWPKAGCYPLAPWSNRVRNARFRFAGEDVALRPHPGAAPHAMHGFAHRRPWSVVAQTGDAIEIVHRHQPDEWPWACEIRQRFTLDGAGVSIDIALRNLSGRPMPAGLGLHPFFAADPDDEIAFSRAADWAADEAGWPTRQQPAQPKACRTRVIDAPSVAFHAGVEGTATLTRADGLRILIERSAPLDQLVVHVPVGGAYACIEPVSHVADAFNLAADGVEGTGLRTLAPGEEMTGRMRLAMECPIKPDAAPVQRQTTSQGRIE